MCLIIYGEKKLPEGLLYRVQEYNPDGIGMMWAQNDSLVMWRGFDIEQMFRLYYYIAAPVAVHFRFATHGDITFNNLHPFCIKPQIGFMHNGIVRVYTRKGWSDTRELAQLIESSSLDDIKLELAHHKQSLNGSRLLFMDGSGATLTLGRWYKKDELLFSNDSILEYL